MEIDEEKFLNTEELMVDYAEMTSFNFGNNSYWNANMVEEDNGLYLQQPYKASKFDLKEMLYGMAVKFGFNSVKA